jgi:hypothetical protein
MMPRPSLAHGMIVANLMVLLRARLDPKEWVVIAEFGLDTGPETLRYPDRRRSRRPPGQELYGGCGGSSRGGAVAFDCRDRPWR